MADPAVLTAVTMHEVLNSANREAIEAALAPLADLPQRTRDAYRRGVRGWWCWCARNERRPWPGRPGDVAAYTAELLAGGASLVNARRRIATMVGGVHRRAGLPDPSNSEAVRALLWPDGSVQQRGRLSAEEEAGIDSALSFLGDLNWSTLRSYRYNLRAWWRWCARNDRRPWPASPDDVAAYVTELLDGGAGLGNARLQISMVLGGAHRRAGLPDPSAGDAVQALLWPNRARQRMGKLLAQDEAVLDSLLASLTGRRASTLRSHRYHLRAWWRWCALNHRTPWPARSGDVAGYATELLGGVVSPRQVRQGIVSVLGGAHRRAGLPDPSAGEDVRALLRPNRVVERRARLARLSAQEVAAIESVLAFFVDLNQSTLRNYRTCLRAWWRWCLSENRRPWPARPEDVVACATELLDGGTSPRSVHLRIVTVLGGVHRRAGLSNPTAGNDLPALLWPDRVTVNSGLASRPRGRLAAPEEEAIGSVLAFYGDLNRTTLPNYRTSLRVWWRWCAGRGRPPWPARPADIAAYEADLLAREGGPLASERRAIQVLAGAHQRAGLPDPRAAVAPR